MAILQKLNSKANIRKTSGGDLPYQTSYPVIARYEADSTASQTLINMTFSVDQANKESFQLFIDGKLLREGSSNDFTFTSIQADNTSSQITLNAPIDANLNIVAIKLGLRVDSLSSGSSAVSSGGSKNYFSLSNANPDFEKNVTSPWLPCTLTWSGTAPSGAPTLTATNMTLSVSNSNPLSGSYSMLLTKEALNAQYQGLISSGLTIDREDVAKVLYGSFSYELVSSVPSTAVDFSGTSTQTYEIWIWNYDPANPSVGQWIQPAGYRGMNQSSGVGKVVFSFQTDGTFTNNAYKVAVITQQTGTGAIVVKFDDFVVGTQAIALGSAMTDPTSYSPILTNAGNATATGSWYRLGSNVVIEATITIGSVLPSGTITISKPSNITPSMAATGLVNTAIVTGSISATGATYDGALRYDIALGTFSFLGGNGQQFWNATVPATWASGDRIRISATMQVSGWSSSSQMSSDSDTRVVAARYTTASGSTGARIQFNTQDFDTHSAVTTGASWVYQAPVSGIYEVRAYVNVGANNIGQNPLNLYKNGVSHQTLSFSGISAANSEVDGAGLVSLNAGDTIYLTVGGTAVTITGAWITINKLSGASIITATESLNAKYYGCTSAISGTLATMTYVTKSFDSHSAYASGIYTLPVSGKFQINAGIWVNATFSAANPIYMAIFNGATEVTRTYLIMQPFAGSGNTNQYLAISDIISGNAGDQITIKAGTGGTTPTVLNSLPIANYFSIARVGN